jgi:hypothetical protein
MLINWYYPAFVSGPEKRREEKRREETRRETTVLRFFVP